jgi:hypothetical protein
MTTPHPNRRTLLAGSAACACAMVLPTLPLSAAERSRIAEHLHRLQAFPGLVSVRFHSRVSPRYDVHLDLRDADGRPLALRRLTDGEMREVVKALEEPEAPPC